MHRKLLVLVLPTLCFLLIATSLYLGRDHLTRLSDLYLPFRHETTPSEAATTSTSASISIATTITTTNAIPEQINTPTITQGVAQTSVSLSSDAVTSATPSPILAISNGRHHTFANQVRQHSNTLQEPFSTLSTFLLTSQPYSIPLQHTFLASNARL